MLHCWLLTKEWQLVSPGDNVLLVQPGERTLWSCLTLVFSIMIDNEEGVVPPGAEGVIEINILSDKVSGRFKTELSLYRSWTSSVLECVLNSFI